MFSESMIKTSAVCPKPETQAAAKAEVSAMILQKQVIL